jgi:hypothetical protein
MEIGWKQVLAELFTRTPALLIVTGGILMALGATGGIVGKTPAMQEVWQIAIFAAGAAALLAGVYAAIRQGTHVDKPKDIKVKITSPIARSDAASRVDIHGEMEGTVPPGYVFRMMRVYRNERMTPIGPHTIRVESKKWSAHDCDIGGKPGELRSVAAFLIGPSGQALLAFFEEAASENYKLLTRLQGITYSAGLSAKGEPVKNTSVREFLESDGSVGIYLPAIKQGTTDMFEYARVELKRV